MGYEDVDKGQNDPGVQGGRDGRVDRPGASVGGSQAGDVSPASAASLDHDGQRDPKGDGQPIASVSMSRMEMVAGPLPSSKEFAGYERVLPGAADRILSMAERSLDSEIDYQKQLVDLYREDRRAENWVFKFTSAIFAVVPAGAVVSAIVFFAMGRNAEALVGAACGFGLYVPQIISAFKGRMPYQDDSAKDAAPRDGDADSDGSNSK